MLQLGMKNKKGEVTLFFVLTNKELQDMKKTGPGWYLHLNGKDMHPELEGVEVILAYEETDKDALAKIKEYEHLITEDTIVKLDKDVLDA